MAERNVADWLANWIADNLDDVEASAEVSESEMRVLRCRADAEKAGITIEELDSIAGGNLEAHLMNAQNTVIDAELRRPGETELS